MSMSDQYDDGRYDPVRQDVAYDPRDYVGPTHAMTSIGYVPITAVRGGIKYPTPVKGNTMAKKLTTAQELKLAEETLSLLQTKVEELKAKAKAEAIPPAPRDALGDAFSLHVKFQNPGKTYRFLILRTDRGYFTTGQSKTGYFESWRALVEWLHSGDIAWHSAMHALDVSHCYPALSEWTRDA